MGMGMGMSTGISMSMTYAPNMHHKPIKPTHIPLKPTYSPKTHTHSQVPLTSQVPRFPYSQVPKVPLHIYLYKTHINPQYHYKTHINQHINPHKPICIVK
jgi:hypothetical protein